MRTLTQRIYEWLDWDYPEPTKEELEADLKEVESKIKDIDEKIIVAEEQSK